MAASLGGSTIRPRTTTTPAPAPTPAPKIGKKATTTPTAPQQANRLLNEQGMPGQYDTAGRYQVLGGPGYSSNLSGPPTTAAGMVQESQGGGGLGFPDYGLGGGLDFGAGGGFDLGTGAGAGGGTVPGFDPLSIEAKPSPEMAAALDAWNTRMGDLESGLEERMSSDTTQREIDRAMGSIRSQAAGLGEAATAEGSRTGKGPGYGAAGIGDTAAMAGAKAAADISLGREKALDELFLGGQTALTNLFGLNPYEATAKLGLSQQELGLQAYLGQLEAQSRNAETAARIAEAKARIYGTPLQWYQSMLGLL